jgi:hypothetical protein
MGSQLSHGSNSGAIASLRLRHPCRCVLPNKRLKLAGAYRLKGIGVLCPRRGTDFVHNSCAGGRVARSLSAIR